MSSTALLLPHPLRGGPSLWVMVRDPDGRAVTSFTVSTGSTVGDLKAALQAAGCTSVTAHDMGLQYSRDQLPDTSTHLDAFHLNIAGARKVKVIPDDHPLLSIGIVSQSSLRAGADSSRKFVSERHGRYAQNEEPVRSRKSKLSNFLNFSFKGLRVRHRGKQLDDERTLSNYKGQPTSYLECAFTLPGGAAGALLQHSIYPDVQICMDHKLLKTDVPFKSEALEGASYISATTGNVACERCILGKNMADWILKDPRTISSDGMSFCISFPGEGRYECSITGLRFQTTAETTITYRYCSWDQYFPDITRRGWSPASSLFDIKVTGAELTAIQIPHFLCIDGKPSENELCFFHMEEEGGNYTVLAPSLVFSKYAVLLKPTFTLIGFVQSIRRMFPVHGIVVIFRAHVAKLTLHVYLIPNSRDIEKAVHSHEKERFSVEINKPPQTRPLRIGQKYSLKTKSSSVVRPEILEFYYLSNNQRQSFCEVRTNDTNIAVDLKFLECSSHGDKCIWECELEPEDMQIQPLKEDMQIQPLKEDMQIQPLKEKHFMDKYKSEIIQRLTNPEPILDHLLSKLYITDEEYDRIRSRDEYQEKNRELYKVCRSWSSKGKDEFYMILRKKNPHFVRSLEEE